jgi:arabinan endo-1,5-alpha-L-arabinosidase
MPKPARLLLTLTLAAGLLAVPAAASAAPAHSAPGHGAVAAPSYQNPLKLQLPGGGQAASCADPYVLKVAGTHQAPTHWYLYCTSDALTATELDSTGAPLIHNVPTFTSTDLTHWTYAGDAFPTKPVWITGGMWAPDVVHRNGEYLMYFTASDTNLPGGGSAIALATSSSPTGPWQVSDTPVVPPTDAPNGGGRRWEFDPEVIDAGGVTYLYFGSYFGGIFARQLTADGRTSVAATEKQIAIDNRYEGTYIVKHDGWYYFMGSATNCCAGPLTGYAVFSARSRSPLGPFLDADGRSILDSRVGGTPMLTQNGNQWVGTGHNAVLTDYSGQQWVVYHAVNTNDPYYAGDVGYTKRPALMDPLDWRAGWPVVRGGQGPSSSPLPGPAAQPWERTAYRPHFISDPQPGHSYARLSDDFSGSALSAQWTWVRPPDPATYTVTGGSLNWQTQNADLHPPATPLASVLTEPAPDGDYVVDTKVSTTVPADGCCQNYMQGGLVIYGDDGNYVKLASVSIWNTRQTEFGKEITPQPTGYPNYGNTVVGPVGDWTYLRIVRKLRGGTDTYTAYTSLDGRHWDHGGTWTHDLGSQPKIGLISMGGSGFTSSFAYVHVAALRK